ncbi:nanos homolog 1-like [Anneissia japonica]|uniref:nanos homolog 1-like n=1 Tax=Anneissia japonica TaxID=1529436 RepID=UPI0014259F3E|nr:nanos homolog 1-like [Anneissia japonica]
MNPQICMPDFGASESCEFQPMNDYLGLSALLLSSSTGSSSSSGGSESTSFEFDTDLDRLHFEFRTNGIDRELDPEDFDSCSGFQPFNPLELSFLDKKVKAGSSKKGRRRISPDWCVFCKNNGEMESVYMSHILKNVDGKVRCPILRKYTCPICGMNGDHAHTIKYCPHNREEERQQPVTLRTPRTSTGCRKDIRISQ